MTYPELETERLLLRGLVPSDAPAIQRLAGDRAIADTTLNIPHPYEDGLAEAWIATHADHFTQGVGVTLAMIPRDGSEPIGVISLMSISQDHSRAELGYWVGRPYWNQGFCTEAGRAVLAFAFEDLRLNRVYAVHLTRNGSSGRVMQKLGMKHEGCQKQHIRKWDVPEDVELYGLLAQDWSNPQRVRDR